MADENCSIVYHCKSDTESLRGDDDIVLSTTSFTEKPITLAVMYGCNDNIMEDTEIWMRRCKASVFHPLILPMIFAEHERKRLFNAIDEKSTELAARILELKKRVKKEVDQDEEKGDKQTMTQRDCEAIDLWRSLSALKNGLESLHGELGSMKEHLHALRKAPPNNVTDTLGFPEIAPQTRLEVDIDTRLKDMMAEFRSKIRSCEGLLGSMTLATQMVRPYYHVPGPTYWCQLYLMSCQEWNYYTRRDAQVNYSIATAARMDGSQMKQISLLGMIFLPGTFLAVSYHSL